MPDFEHNNPNDVMLLSALVSRQWAIMGDNHDINRQIIVHKLQCMSEHLILLDTPIRFCIFVEELFQFADTDATLALCSVPSYFMMHWSDQVLQSINLP